MMVLFFILLFSAVVSTSVAEGDYEVVTPRLETIPVHHRKARSTSNVAAQQGDVLIYKLTAFGETVHLHLQPNDQFISTSFLVEYIGANGRGSMKPGSGTALRKCFYTGSSHGGEIPKPAAFSVCGGLSGAYITDNGQFFVEPLDDKANRSFGGWMDAADRPHIVYKRKPVNSTNSSDCGLAGRMAKDVQKLSDTFKRRRRSQSMENYVETLIVADEEMYRYHKQKTEHYLLVVSSVVAHLFQDPSLKNFVRVVIVRMVIFQQNPTALEITNSAHLSLYSFCRWQKEHNYPDHHELHHDTAMLFTRKNICRSRNRCDTLGLAELGAICDPARSCTINEDNGLSVSLTAAHELGHILNMPHDGETSDCHLRPSEYRLMAPTLSSHTNPWSWSQCSSRALTSFLDGGNGVCLLDRPAGNAPKYDLPEELPGQMFDLNQQCEVAFGPGIHSCKYIQDQVPCRRLWCSTSSPGCRTRHMPWAEGTPCGHKKWCIKGKCVVKESDTTPIDGGWGNWESFSQCTRTCGGGVQFSQRECNAPVPANGGQYCVGQRRMYRSCNTQECPQGSTPFRELQCRSFNGARHNFNDLPLNVHWSPKYNLKASDMCKLFCYADRNSQYYRLAAKVIDGTPCHPDSLDICVEGQCRPAGCDHVLGSEAKIDKCGVCGGDGSSCRLVSGYLDKTSYGYNDVVTFPAGTTSVQVNQPPIFARDDNYLALRRQAGGYLFNGEYKINVGRYRYLAAGSQWFYNGSQSGVETLRAAGPLKEPVTLSVLSIGSERRLKLNWQFNAPVMKRSYHWVQGDWQDCDSDCQGHQKRIVECRRDGQVSVAEDEMCNSNLKPQPESQRCNTNCSYEWVKRRTSYCSVTCGRGVYRELLGCFRRQAGTRAQQTSSKHCEMKAVPVTRTWTCQMEACPESGEWRAAVWKSCSASCGGGVQSRNVRCVNSILNRILAEEACAGSPKPVTRQACNQSPCTNYRWRTGNWGTCSQTCGIGARRRAVTCSDRNGWSVDTSYCSTQDRPSASEECITRYCTSWKSGDWTMCSSSCGAGQQTRPVSCVDTAGHVVDPQNCSAFKPMGKRGCQIRDCPSGQWQLTNWSSCSASCGKGVHTRHVICANDDGQELGDSVCNGSNKPVEERQECVVDHSCYQWHEENWGQCTRSCAGGKARRVVRCQTLDGQPAEVAMCQHTKRPVTTKSCNKVPCPKWSKVSWSQCSLTCGRGTKHRSVHCIGHDKQRLTDDMCNLKKKPSVSKSCQQSQCPRWYTGAWSSCSRSCGEGVRTRKVECRRKHHRMVESKCPRPVPSSSVTCVDPRCPDFSWSVSDWEPCSTTCGNGVKTRTVQCVNAHTRMPVGSENCQVDSRPRNSDYCQSTAPCPGQWTARPWNECSVTCGNGVQTRRVDCVSGDRIVGGSYCSGSPVLPKSQSCGNTPCSSVVWYYGDWMSCDKSCGGGVQRRSHYCTYQHSHVTRLQDQLCVARHGKPLSQQACNSNACPSGLRQPTSCQDVKLQRLGHLDGTYSILSGAGGVLEIYCYGMKTAHPKEFVTLSNPNYAMIYNATLRNPSTCPTNVNWNSPHLNKQAYPGQGRTTFSRVRIDVQSMELIANDYTFATKENATERFIEYGSAGDCFSSAERCPKGEFRIDLTNTGLRVDHENNWLQQGQNSTMRIDTYSYNQIVRAKCGGLCGRCYSARAKIKVTLT